MADIVSTIAQTIQQFEGWLAPGSPGYPTGSLSYRNNNPGNIIWYGQSGATAGAGGFAAYPSYAAGWQALLNQLNYMIQPGYTSPQGQSYPAGVTLNQMMEIYAPIAQNPNQPQYIAAISAATGIDPNQTVISAVNGTGSDVATDPSNSIFDTGLTVDPSSSLPAVSNLPAWFSSLSGDSQVMALGLGVLAVLALVEVL